MTKRTRTRMGWRPERAHFLSARPVWPAGREREMNLSVGFRAVFAVRGGTVTLRVAAASVYRAFLNGEHLGYGPARAALGWHRVDVWNLTHRMKPGKNVVAIEVAGYNVNSFYLMNQPAFLQAEVVEDGRVLAATGAAATPFAARPLTERVQKVRRYSPQRPFTEAYRLRPGADLWRSDPKARVPAARCAVLAAKRLLSRGVAYPAFERRAPARLLETGRLRTGVKPLKPLVQIDAAWLTERHLLGFPDEALEINPAVELQCVRNVASKPGSGPLEPGLKLAAKSYNILDFGVNLTGFIGAELLCRKPTRLFFAFAEILTDGDVNFKRLHGGNVVALELAPGRYRFESFEPYTLRYLKLMTLGGDCEARGIYLREYANPDAGRAEFAASDDRLNRIFEAGRETFRQNAVDLFTDCPSRERAGWLCDSFFTAHAAPALCGDTRVERNFLENFLLPRSFPHLPKGMLPKCYPADHYNGNFIPNWALWFVLQLEEYLARGGEPGLVEALRGKVLGLFEYFRRFRNEHGLLEKLESWVFVEWSEANKFVQDVNYPSNMLYAGALAAAGRMYDLPKLLRQAARVRAAVRRLSFDGQFFVDNALRRDGRLEATRNRTEVCQYYAFYFDIASPETHPRLWRTLVTKFGPRRDLKRSFPEIHPANAFIGAMLRMELLSRHGRVAQMLDESSDYWLYMAERTGTLWEFLGPVASCNHGFTSHIVHGFCRDVLGLRKVDPVGKKIVLRLHRLPLAWCRGRVPTPDGPVWLSWERRNRRIICNVTVPAGYTVETENPDHPPLRVHFQL